MTRVADTTRAVARGRGLIWRKKKFMDVPSTEELYWSRVVIALHKI